MTAGREADFVVLDEPKRVEIGMTQIIAHPPNFAEIKAAFPMAEKSGVLFAFGDKIFNPSGIYIEPHLLAHEAVHGKQQSREGVERWWKKYIEESSYRYDQELEAHVVEYVAVCEMSRNKGQRKRMLDAIASRLSGELYGRVVSFAHARDIIAQLAANNPFGIQSAT